MENRALPFQNGTAIPFLKQDTSATGNSAPNVAKKPSNNGSSSTSSTTSPTTSQGVHRTPVTRRRVTAANSAIVVPTVVDSIPVSELGSYMRGWASDGQFRRLSDQTLDARTRLLNLLSWWCQQEKVARIDRASLKNFFVYLATAHETGSRWNKNGPCDVVYKRELRPETTATYFRILRTFFRYLVKE